MLKVSQTGKVSGARPPVRRGWVIVVAAIAAWVFLIVGSMQALDLLAVIF